ncbi:hypothetical protein BC936DRAFT_147882 [Jimgerdemannia flammicorona]|uniref:Uncharacterized protein n=2 Tax=Jimgerdemannia flammicorona TaxID=994334 RepID=A0A433QFD4_9FUNG|nr:hypothetical protein BC936DRAFT_147882 [Jimgerdemannia flammicorona]RUS28469.1 hypothetical protein BC938DRAFT_481845 [Jimgerdemannia flammicorona]
MQEISSLRALRDTQSLETLAAWRIRGEQFFSRVYDRHTDRVMSALMASSPDLADMVAQEAYGKILSDTQVLGDVETELVVIAALVPMEVPAQTPGKAINGMIFNLSRSLVLPCFVPSQLKGHVHGAKNVGASELQVTTVLALAETMCSRLRQVPISL